MRIELREHPDDKFPVVLTDEELDNDNYVDIILGCTNVTVSLDALISATEAFSRQRTLRLERDKLLK